MLNETKSFFTIPQFNRFIVFNCFIVIKCRWYNNNCCTCTHIINEKPVLTSDNKVRNPWINKTSIISITYKLLKINYYYLLFSVYLHTLNKSNGSWMIQFSFFTTICQTKSSFVAEFTGSFFFRTMLLVQLIITHYDNCWLLTVDWKVYILTDINTLWLSIYLLRNTKTCKLSMIAIEYPKCMINVLFGCGGHRAHWLLRKIVDTASNMFHYWNNMWTITHQQNIVTSDDPPAQLQSETYPLSKGFTYSV